jgi:preprotein translocase subunit SecA
LAPLQSQQQMQEGRMDPALQAEQRAIGGYKVNPVRQHVKPEDRDPNDPSTWGKVGRNELCPCGSGKKYKHCHGALS